ncbi:efflux pump antibiotic resistance protein [Rutstroemia sp. NJR-2017a BBW]|nr:efflux pump antibiotic resistance protein [Rutstroemia sp. NJR-2017a BBW]
MAIPDQEIPHTVGAATPKVENDVNAVEVSSSDTTAPFLRSWRLAIVIGSLCLGVFLLALDMNIIGVAIPRITSDFHSLDDVAWYGSAYLLTVTAFQPFFGNLFKYFDPKLVYMGSIALFEVGSILCAVAPSSNVLIGGRSLLGFGAAGIHQGSLTIINYAVELEKRPLYQGIVISAFAVSVCVGPVLGGAFTDKALILSTVRLAQELTKSSNLPLGAVVIFVIWIFFHLGNTKDSNRALPLSLKLKRMDIPGIIIFLGAIYCLLLALQWGGQTMPWNSGKIIGLLIGFVLLAVSFATLQWKLGEYATIPVRIIRHRSIYMGSLFLMLFGMMSFVGVDAVDSGARFIALVLPQIIGLMITGAIVTKWGYYVHSVGIARWLTAFRSLI